MLNYTRRLAMTGFAALALAACGGSGSSDAPSGTDAGETKLVLKDIVIGDPDAPVTMVEYASWTCGACLFFHNDVMPTVQRDYIDTGKVKFVFREFPTPPMDVSVAGFLLARCAGPGKNYDVIEELFSRQAAFLTLARNGGQVKEALLQVAENHGISGSDAYDACIADEDNKNAVSASIQAGRAKEVQATPTIYLNGVMLSNDARVSAVAFAAELDKALAAAGAAE